MFASVPMDFAFIFGGKRSQFVSEFVSEIKTKGAHEGRL
jgi:hypothetical protein